MHTVLGSRPAVAARGRTARAIRHPVNVFSERLEARVLLSAGDLDPTFGMGGSEVLPAASGSLQFSVATTAVQSDGKTVLAGSASLSNSPSSYFFVERLNLNGSPDPTFGSGGIVTTNLGGRAQASSILIQGDGRIVVGGSRSSGGSLPDSDWQFALARYNSSGSLDSSFGTGGTILTRIPGRETLESLALMGDGRILAAGNGTYQDPAHPGDPSYWVHAAEVARYTPQGNLDTTFNGAGYVYEPDGDPVPANTGVAAVAVQGDGKVVLGSNLNFAFAAWRFNADGSPDVSFGLGGLARTDLFFADLQNDEYDAGTISKILVQADGKILAAGPVDINSGQTENWFLTRYNPNGSVDTSLSGGIVQISVGPSGSSSFIYPSSLLLQGDGKILISGANSQFSSGPFIVKRFLSDGTPDAAFQYKNNAFPASVMNGSTGATALTPNGKIMLVGGLWANSYPPAGGIGVARLLGDSTTATSTGPTALAPASPSPAAGNLDPGFGISGRQLYPDPLPGVFPNSTERRVRAVAVLVNGQILMAGSTGTRASDGNGQVLLERVNADGSVDRTFGSSGLVQTSFGPVSFATAVLVLPDGKILIGGAIEDRANAPTDASFLLARYNANGTLDMTFGNGGSVICDFAGNEQVDSLALAPGGKIVAAGSYFHYPNVGFDVARFNADGTLDATFNGTGKLSYDLGQTGNNSRTTGLAVQQDGKIVIASHLGAGFAAYRFTQTGAPDPSFGNAGVANTAGALSPDYFLATPDGAIAGAASGIVIQPDGRIVLAGPVQSYPALSYALVRLQPDGSVDRGFGSQGVALAIAQQGLYSPGPQPVGALLLRADGRIILAGSTQSYGSPDTPVGQGLAPFVQQFMPDGTKDPNFGMNTDPAFVPPLVTRGATTVAAALAPDGDLVLAADVWASSSLKSLHWTGLARYQDPTAGSQGTAVVSTAAHGTNNGSQSIAGVPVSPAPASPRAASPNTYALTITGTAHDDTIELSAGANGALIANVNGVVTTYAPSQFQYGVEIDTLGADTNDTLKVDSLPATGLTVTSGGMLNATVGTDARGLQDVAATILNFTDGTGKLQLTVNDGADPVARDVRISNYTYSAIDGIMAGEILLNAKLAVLNLGDAGNVVDVNTASSVVIAPIPVINVNTGNGDDTVNVYGTAAETVLNINGQSGHDAVTVTASYFQHSNIQGVVNVANPMGKTHLLMNIDATYAAVLAMTLDTFAAPGGTYGSIQGLTAAPINFAGEDMERVDILPGQYTFVLPADSVVIDNTPGGGPIDIAGLVSAKVLGIAPGQTLNLYRARGISQTTQMAVDFSAGRIGAGSHVLADCEILSVTGASAGDRFMAGGNALTHSADGATVAFDPIDLIELDLSKGTFTAPQLTPIAVGLHLDTSATVMLTGSGQIVSDLNINSGCTLALSPAAAADPPRKLVVYGPISIAGKLEVGSNALELHTATLQQVRALLQTGLGRSSGITSSAADASHALGNRTIDQATGWILVKWARYGDANLDGTVDFSDLLVLGQNFGRSNATWDQGDFNYDGIVSFADLLVLAQNYGRVQTPDAPSVSKAAVAKATRRSK